MFQKNGYHITVASIYIISGAIVLLYNMINTKDYQLSMLGGVIIIYGLFRILKLKKNDSKNEI